MGFDFADFPKQFIVTRTDPSGIAGAERDVFGDWRIHAAPGVPRVPVEAADGTPVGLLIGWAFDGARPLGARAPLRLGADAEFETDALPDLWGRFVCLWRDGGRDFFRLDAGGLLPAVFHPDRGMIASTPTLIDALGPLPARAEVAALFDFPARRGFLPFGLTAHEGVTRLLPNHRLDLGTWKTERVWPGPEIHAAPLLTEAEARALVPDVAARVRGHVAGVLGDGPGRLYLSGGRDSRMVLAAARDFRDRMTCETMVNESGMDRHVAARVAAAAGVPLVLTPIVPSSREEVADWIRRAGNTLYDPVTELAATARLNDRRMHVLTGTCAEIARASNWWEEDLAAPALGLDVLLNRLRLPDAPVVRNAALAWLAGLPPMDATMALDMAKIEQIHGCWAAVSVYGHMTAWPSLSPFANQRIYGTALRLPKDYKFGQGFYADFMASAWPELLEVPVNRVTGIERLRHPKEELKKMLPVKLKRWLKPMR
jgi:hypothetical protein